jgi:hypothetical protein
MIFFYDAFSKKMKGKRMFRSWRKISVESQESMEHSNKRQKISTAHDECELTGLNIEKETSVKIDSMQFWAPGLLLFSKYFNTVSSTSLLPYLEEAKEKSKTEKTPTGFFNFVKSELEREDDIQETSLNELNIQQFWLLYLGILEQRLLSHLKLEHPSTLFKEILSLYYHLTLMLHCNIPEEAMACLNHLCKTLDETLMGESFWEFNPIHLTQAHVWAHKFCDDLLEDHSKRIKTTHIAHSFFLAKSQHPLTGLQDISEEQVCDQQLALRLARGELSSDYQEAVEWNTMVFAGVVNQVYQYSGDGVY